MIVALCANPALDVTYRVGRLLPGAVHPVERVLVRPGGKATNTARVLARLGEPVALVAPLGGPAGAAFEGSSLLAGVELHAVAVGANIRTCVAVVDDVATVFNEPGSTLTPAEWQAVEERVLDLLGPDDVLVAAGSTPPGVPADAYARLAEQAHATGASVVVDARGDLLDRAAARGADVVAPNLDEAGPVVGSDDPAECARLLVRRGAGCAVVSAGTEGVFACSGEVEVALRPPRLVTGNPTGAGDALTASVARALGDASRRGQAWDAELPDALADAVATAGAAVAAGVAGEIDLDVRRELLAALRDEVSVCR